MTQKAQCEYTGLNDAEVEASRAKHGVNALPPPQRTSAWKLFFEKFKDPIICILLAAAVISALTGGFIEGAGIILAVILATGIAFLNEYRANKEFDILNKVDDSLPFKAIRNGEFVQIPKQDLVVDDVVFLETGEEVPADSQVLSAVNLHVDQSKFTGEPEPVPKMPKQDGEIPESMRNATYPYDQLLRGSTVLEGYGYVRITAVGGNTEMGRTASAAMDITSIETPLQKQLNRLGKLIAIVGTTLSLTLLAILIAQGLSKGSLPGSLSAYAQWENIHTLLGLFMIAVTLIVVAVPEGLAMSVTLSLAYSMRRMTASNCLVRKLHACETIGATTVICTDKTGTLTMNQMRTRSVDIPSLPGIETLNPADETAKFIAESICANSTANLHGDDATLEIIGNPTEGALLEFVRRSGFPYQEIRSSFKLERQWTFTTETKMMATQGSSALLSKQLLYVKGAPEIVLSKCSKQKSADGMRELTQADRDTVMEKLYQAQGTGCRTLALAYRETDRLYDELADAAQDLVYLGFVSIADPVRPEVPAAVQACRDAGIQIKVVTGDTPGTASEIGRRIGLWDTPRPPEGTLIEGRDFAKLSEAETQKEVEPLRLIARARPDDKMKLVKALQANNEVVAVTGDGTNDAPALNYANVGIAMGKTGTAIAREASDIILLDDSFGSIVKAVLWGRSLYLNIQRFLVFQLTINVAAVGIALLGPFIGISLPLTVIQMLWINLIMDTMAALALATEAPNPELMKRPPRDPDAFIVTKKMALDIFITAAVFIGIFIWYVFTHTDKSGVSAENKCIIFSGFVMLQFWNLLNVKCFGTKRSVFAAWSENPTFWIIAAIIPVGQILITQFGGKMFGTVPLNLNQWLSLIGFSALILVIGEIVRLIARIKGKA